jgi:hypothetical protein
MAPPSAATKLKMRSSALALWLPFALGGARAAAVASLAATRDASCDADDSSFCAARGSAVKGSAMLQTAQEKDALRSIHDHTVVTAGEGRQDAAADEEKDRQKAKSAPLKLRVEGLEKEMTALKERVAAVQADVGVSGGAAGGAAEEPALLGKSPRTATSARRSEGDQEKEEEEDSDAEGEDSLLQSSKGNRAQLTDSKVNRTDTEDDSIKGRVMALEADMAQVKSDISVLENQVIGKASLLQAAGGRGSGSGSESGSGSSLKSRVVALEDTADACRSRVNTLEHEVSG